MTVTQDTFVFAFFGSLASPSPPAFVGALLIAASDTFLVNVNANPFATYGSSFALYSPYDSYSMSPPGLYVDGGFYRCVTRDPFPGGVDPDKSAFLIGRFDVMWNQSRGTSVRRGHPGRPAIHAARGSKSLVLRTT